MRVAGLPEIPSIAELFDSLHTNGSKKMRTKNKTPSRSGHSDGRRQRLRPSTLNGYNTCCGNDNDNVDDVGWLCGDGCDDDGDGDDDGVRSPQQQRKWPDWTQTSSSCCYRMLPNAANWWRFRWLQLAAGSCSGPVGGIIALRFLRRAISVLLVRYAMHTAHSIWCTLSVQMRTSVCVCDVIGVMKLLRARALAHTKRAE